MLNSGLELPVSSSFKGIGEEVTVTFWLFYNTNPVDYLGDTEKTFIDIYD